MFSASMRLERDIAGTAKRAVFGCRGGACPCPLRGRVLAGTSPAPTSSHPRLHFLRVILRIYVASMTKAVMLSTAFFLPSGSDVSLCRDSFWKEDVILEMDMLVEVSLELAKALIECIKARTAIGW